MIKTKEKNKNENNDVKYSETQILNKIKDYLNESTEFYDKTYFMAKRIDEITTLLKIYGNDKFNQICKKLELEWFFKTYPNKKYLKDHYMKNYSFKKFDYDKYHFMIKEVNRMAINQYHENQCIDYEKNFRIAYILWKIHEYPEKIKINCPSEYDEDQTFKLVLDTLHNANLDIFLKDIDLEEFKDEIFVWTYDEGIITKRELCISIYNSFIKKETKKWICN